MPLAGMMMSRPGRSQGYPPLKVRRQEARNSHRTALEGAGVTCPQAAALWPGTSPPQRLVAASQTFLDGSEVTIPFS